MFTSKVMPLSVLGFVGVLLVIGGLVTLSVVVFHNDEYNSTPQQEFIVNLGGNDWSLVNGAGNTSLTGVTVPGDVHTALFTEGVIDDPYFR
jgi:hypothetical protein